MAKKKTNYDLCQIIQFMQIYHIAKTADDQMKEYERTRETPNMLTQQLTPRQIRQGLENVSRYISEMPSEIRDFMSLNASQLLEKLKKQESMLQYRMPIYQAPPLSFRER